MKYLSQKDNIWQVENPLGILEKKKIQYFKIISELAMASQKHEVISELTMASQKHKDTIKKLLA